MTITTEAPQSVHAAVRGFGIKQPLQRVETVEQDGAMLDVHRVAPCTFLNTGSSRNELGSACDRAERVEPVLSVPHGFAA